MAQIATTEPEGAGPGAAAFLRQSRFYQDRIVPIVGYSRRNPSLLVGLGLILGLFLIVAIGLLTYPRLDDHVTGGAPIKDKAISPSWCTWCDEISERDERPSLWQYPMGTDVHSRDLYAVFLQGTPRTIGTGLIAGFLSIFVGTITAFVAAYYRGIPDTLIRLLTDVGISIPGLIVLIIIRIQLGTELTWWQTGVSLAVVGWVFSSRTIRSQVLVMREQPYVEIARQSGSSGMSIIVREMIPNLIPYITASFVAAVAGSILATIGLEALGLGDLLTPSLGIMIYYVTQLGAVTLGLWWWWLFPVAAIVIIFVALFLISAGLDEWSNPRLRKQV